MKVAVYTIVKDEEQFIARWAGSAADADYRVIVDTGSADNTVEMAKNAGCIVHEIKISPWRFDDARNAALALLPEDVDWCISLDADEVLLPGWRQALESLPDDVTRPSYKYVWSWNKDGTEDLVFAGEHIHRRYGYRWIRPVHEFLFFNGPETQEFCTLEIHHYPDETKSRSQYLALLELAAQESPDCDRTAHYLGREYVFNGMYDLAVKELKRHLGLESAKWSPERAASMRYLAICPGEDGEGWLLRACGEAPDRRESWVSLANYYFGRRLWKQSLAAIDRAVLIESKPLDYLCESYAWSGQIYDTAAICCWNLGWIDEANKYGRIAVELEPDNERFFNNLQFYKEIY